MLLKNGFCVLFLIFLGVSFALEDVAEENENATDTNRELRNLQDWRSVDYFSPPSETSGWVPSPDTEDEPRRRRIRKRKRKPPMTTQENKKPQRLDEVHEPSWDQIEEEGHLKPAIRRRLIPVFQDSVESFEKIRDPFTALQEEEEKQRQRKQETTTQTAALDLKTLLKQSGGLSLSEVLQQKNLSLAELLKGNKKAISALAETAEMTTVPPFDRTDKVEKSEKFETHDIKVSYKRLPPSAVLKKTTDRPGHTREPLTSQEMLDAQRKRLSLLHNKDNKLFGDVTKFEVITEATTEKRVFVPSDMLYELPKEDQVSEERPSEERPSEEDSSEDYSLEKKTEGEKAQEAVAQKTKPQEAVAQKTKPQEAKTHETKTLETKTHKEKPSETHLREEKPQEITRVIPETTSQLTVTKPKHRLPVTSAKLKPRLQSTTIPSTIPPKAVKIDLNEIFALNVETSTEESGPFKMVIDLDELDENVKPEAATKRIDIARPATTARSTTTSMPLMEKLKRVTAKEEIMEILRNPSDRAQLSRILESRNMTLQELVEQRERGSSQRHLADIFHNKTREPEPKEEPAVGQIGYVKNFPVFRRQKSESQPTEKPKMYTITSFPTYKIESKPYLPMWKDLYPDLFNDVPQDFKPKDQTHVLATTTSGYDDIQLIEDVDNALSESANNQLNIDIIKTDEEEFINLPSGVKSAMLASFVIIGLSLLVFLTILLIFKWSQKQKRRGLSYCATSLSGSRIKSPILEPIQRRSLRTFVSETLGRKKNYYKSHLQSMSDSIWEHDNKKPYL